MCVIPQCAEWCIWWVIQYSRRPSRQLTLHNRLKKYVTDSAYIVIRCFWNKFPKRKEIQLELHMMSHGTCLCCLLISSVRLSSFSQGVDKLQPVAVSWRDQLTGRESDHTSQVSLVEVGGGWFSKLVLWSMMEFPSLRNWRLFLESLSVARAIWRRSAACPPPTLLLPQYYRSTVNITPELALQRTLPMTYDENFYSCAFFCSCTEHYLWVMLFKH